MKDNVWGLLVGNTRAVAALLQEGKVLARSTVATETLRARRGLLAWVKRLHRIAPGPGVLVASVVPALDRSLKDGLRRNFGAAPLFLDHRHLGIGVRLIRPSEAGADRLANALAACRLYGRPSIVVDFGTGTTFDVVDRKGDYRGGAILPGPGTSLRALKAFTAKIPLVPFAKAGRAVGRDTAEAVRSGIYFGAIGTTRELLQRIRREIGRKAPAIATGGWCRAFAGTGLFQAIDPDLTLKGLELAWKEWKGNRPHA